MFFARPYARTVPALCLLMLFGSVLASCSSANVKPVSPEALNYTSEGRGPNDTGGLFGNKGLSLQLRERQAQLGAKGLGVNAYLWRGALDTLSFMPLASADPFGGVIITDWYQPPTVPNERFKATAYILSPQLVANGVRVVLFRQLRQHGDWVNAPVARSTEVELEDQILARARQLYVASKSD